MLRCTACFLVMVLAGLAQAGEGPVAARFAVAGQAGFGDQVAPLKSAITRWDPDSRELVIGLFPFEVSDQDVEKVRVLRVIFYVTAGKPSPDPVRWPAAPYLVFSCHVAEGEPGEAAMLDGCNLNVVNWRSRSTLGVALDTRVLADIIQAFAFDPADPTSLVFKVNEQEDRPGAAGFRYSAVLVANPDR